MASEEEQQKEQQQVPSFSLTVDTAPTPWFRRELRTNSPWKQGIMSLYEGLSYLESILESK